MYKHRGIWWFSTRIQLISLFNRTYREVKNYIIHGQPPKGCFIHFLAFLHRDDTNSPPSPHHDADNSNPIRTFVIRDKEINEWVKRVQLENNTYGHCKKISILLLSSFLVFP